MQTTRSHVSPGQRRRNVRLALILAAFVLFMLLSSIPFWKGLYNLVMSSAQ
jgi:hypothetical protein